MNSQTAAAPIVGAAVFTHGTLAANELGRSGRFYREFLGIKSVRHVPPARVITSGDCEFGIACVGLNGNAPEQSRANRWVVSLASADDVRALQARGSAEPDTFGILTCDPIEEFDGVVSFRVQDSDKNWWEVTNKTTAAYDRFFGQTAAA